MHIINKQGQPQAVRELPNWGDHFTFDGHTVLELPTGEYQFVIEHGPEYRLCTGYFTLVPGAADSKSVEMVRFIDLPGQGWYSGDLSVYRDLEDIEHLLRAEDLYVAPVTTWSEDTNQFARGLPAEPLVQINDNRYYQQLAGAAGHAGGCLRLFNLPEPLPLENFADDPLALLEAVRTTPSGHADIGLAASWDTPAWLASGMIDSICLADEQLGRGGANESEYELREPVGDDFPGPHSAGLWAQKIYYELLNTGLPDRALGRERLGSHAQPPGLQPGVCLLRHELQLRHVVGQPAQRSGDHHQRAYALGPGPTATTPVTSSAAAAGESIEIDIARQHGHSRPR